MIVKIYRYYDYVPGAGREEFFEFYPVKGSKYYGHIDTGDTPARLETDEYGIRFLYIGDDTDGYTAEQIVANCAVRGDEMYFHRH